MSHASESPGRPLRIAQVIQNLNYGGMERVLHSLATELPRRGFEVHVIVLEYFGHFAEGLGDSVTLHQVSEVSRGSLIWPRALVTLLRQIKPDVVHSHAGVWFKAVRAARLARVPRFVQTEHGRSVPDRLSDCLVDALASRKTDAVVAVSEPLAEFLARRIVGDPSRLQVIPNGVEAAGAVPDSTRAARRSALGLPEDALIIGSVGRLESVKHYRLAIQALAGLGAVPGAMPAPVLVLVGDGSDRPALEEFAKTRGVAARVKFLGWRDDTSEIYPVFDIFTLTSRSEGTSISLLESMSWSLCPVVTDVGGNRAVLGPELEAQLVPDNDVSALIAALRRCLDDPHYRAERGRLARARVVQRYSLGHMVDQYVTLYHDMFRRERI